MRISNLIFRLVLLLALLPLNPCFAANALNDAAKQQTYQVGCVTSDDRLGLGSGFLIDGGRRLVTNWHVVECLGSSGTRGAAAIITTNEDEISLTLEWHSEKKDLAILKVQRPLNTSATFATRSTLEERDPVVVAGFPGAALRIDGQLGQVSFTEGIISKFTEINGVRHIQTNAAVHHGNSGGPLYDEKGRVIGVVVAVATTELEQGQGQVAASGISYAILSDELLAELDKLGIRYQAQKVRDADRPQSNESVPNSPPTQEIGNPQSSTESSSPNPSAGTSNSSIKGSVLAVFLLLVLIATIVYRSQQTQPAPSPPRNRAAHMGERDFGTPQRARQQPNLQLRCLQGPDKGGVVPIDSNPLTLGRDARQSQWVMPADAKKVSRRHCRICCNSDGRVTLEDCGSSFGTFMADGKKITPKVPVTLQAGDRFYLGSPSHMFQIEEGLRA